MQLISLKRKLENLTPEIPTQQTEESKCEKRRRRTEFLHQWGLNQRQTFNPNEQFSPLLPLSCKIASITDRILQITKTPVARQSEKLTCQSDPIAHQMVSEPKETALDSQRFRRGAWREPELSTKGVFSEETLAQSPLPFTEEKERLRTAPQLTSEPVTSETCFKSIVLDAPNRDAVLDGKMSRQISPLESASEEIFSEEITPQFSPPFEVKTPPLLNTPDKWTAKTPEFFSESDFLSPPTSWLSPIFKT